MKIYPEDNVKRGELILQRKEFNPFQTFYLVELLRFAADKI